MKTKESIETEKFPSSVAKKSSVGNIREKEEETIEKCCLSAWIWFLDSTWKAALSWMLPTEWTHIHALHIFEKKARTWSDEDKWWKFMCIHSSHTVWVLGLTFVLFPFAIPFFCRLTFFWFFCVPDMCKKKPEWIHSGTTTATQWNVMYKKENTHK